jgi:hypothetical protein
MSDDIKAGRFEIWVKVGTASSHGVNIFSDGLIQLGSPPGSQPFCECLAGPSVGLLRGYVVFA